MTASLWRKRVKLLVRLKLPVTHLPAGTNSNPPPSDPNWLRWAIAFWNAFEFDVTPSLTPPKSSNDTLWALQLADWYSNDSTINWFRHSTDPRRRKPVTRSKEMWIACWMNWIEREWDASIRKLKERFFFFFSVVVVVSFLFWGFWEEPKNRGGEKNRFLWGWRGLLGREMFPTREVSFLKKPPKKMVFGID